MRRHSHPFEVTVERLAGLVGCSRAHLSTALNERGLPVPERTFRPSPELAIRIEAATQGAIRRGELRPDLWPSDPGQAA